MSFLNAASPKGYGSGNMGDHRRLQKKKKKEKLGNLQGKPIIFNYLQRIAMLRLVDLWRVDCHHLQKLTTNSWKSSKGKKIKHYFSASMSTSG